MLTPRIPARLQVRLQRAHLFALQGNFAEREAKWQQWKPKRKRRPGHCPSTTSLTTSRESVPASAMRRRRSIGCELLPTVAGPNTRCPVRRDPAVARFLAALKLIFKNHQREFGTDQP